MAAKKVQAKTKCSKPRCKATKPRGSLKDRLLKGLNMLLDPGEEGRALRRRRPMAVQGSLF